MKSTLKILFLMLVIAGCAARFFSSLVITQVSDYTYPTRYLDQGSTLSINFDNTVTSSDAGVSYVCTFDRVIDGAVSTGTDCSSLTGTASFSSTTGVLSWTPDYSVLGSYEIKVTATKVAATHSRVFVVSVRPGYSTSKLRGDWDAQFADLTKTYSSVNSTWQDLTGNGNYGTSSSTSHVTWTGSGIYSSPYAASFDGSGDMGFGSSLMSGQTQMAFFTWLNSSSSTSTDKVILGNSDNAAGNGMTVRQSLSQSGKIEFVVGKSYQEVILVDSPVAYWRLGESSGTAAVDISGSGNTGTYGGGYTLAQSGSVTGDGDTAAYFNGTGSVSASRAMTNTDNFTIEAWIYPTVLPQNNAVIVYNGNDAGGYGLSIGGPGNSSQLYALYGSVLWINSGYTFPVVNTWYHVVMVRTSGTLDFWVNGVQTASSSAANPNSPNAAFAIGQEPANARFYAGSVDEVAAYNIALTPAQILAHYNAGIATYGGA